MSINVVFTDNENVSGFVFCLSARDKNLLWKQYDAIRAIMNIARRQFAGVEDHIS